ncbi:MAG TPA: HAMP domain-containing sensor histidine kinase, partial [Methanocella sp.]|nr:HAMP domain-containing sensor histidine kinase [Methanocella sp.]
DRSEFFLDLMSHDINNMNHTGMGYLEIALYRLKGSISPEDAALIEKAYDALKSSSALIGNVRNIKEVQTEQHRLETFNLCQMLQELAKKYARYHGRDINISYKPPSGGCYIRAHRLFQEALSNIIENAIKHSDPSRPLAIDMSLDRITERGTDFCRVIIEDNGPGIPGDVKESIFTRFKRGETRTGGRGLGLYIVKMLVDEFGGRVWVEDRVPGDYRQGARFVILMPAVEP